MATQNVINNEGGGGSPGGSSTQVQFNDSGVFGGDAGFTYDKTTDTATLVGGVVVGNTGLTVGASVPFSDSAGTLTLQNVDAIDATTEATIESALDTLPNVTSIQGQSVSLSGGLTVPSAATVSNTNTGDQNLFSTIAVSGQSNVVADSTNDTLTLVAGTNVTITTDAATDSITINASGGGGGGIGGSTGSTDNAVLRADGTGGSTLQSSGVTISDADAVSGITQLNVDNLRLDGNAVSSTNTNGNIQIAPNGSGVFDVLSQTNVNTGSSDYRVFAGGTGTITETAAGSSTNINMNLVPKGSGRLQAGGVNVPTISSTDTLTNKTIDGASNTLTNLPAGGSDTEIQFNNGGTIAGDADMTYSTSLNRLTVGNVLARDLLGFFDATDTNALYMYTDEELTADRTLNVKVNDANRTLTVAGDATISGTNTGDQNLSGLVPYTGATTNVALGSNNLSGAGISGSTLASSGTTTVGNGSSSYHVFAGGTTSITDTATGGGSNIDINIVPKGTGRLQAAGVTVPTISSTDTLTNKTINGSNNTITNVSLTTGVTGTLPVANGGTGVATATAYAVLCGGTTGTGAFQSVSGVGTSGQVLTSNGTDALPTWQNNTPTESIIIACSDETSDLTTGTAKVTFRMPYAFTLTAVRASVTTAPTGASLLTIDINEGGSTILSTKITIDASEKTSTTAATQPVISDSSLADDAEMTVDIDQVGSTTPGKGLKVYLIGKRQ